MNKENLDFYTGEEISDFTDNDEKVMGITREFANMQIFNKYITGRYAVNVPRGIVAMKRLAIKTCVENFKKELTSDIRDEFRKEGFLKEFDSDSSSSDED